MKLYIDINDKGYIKSASTAPIMPGLPESVEAPEDFDWGNAQAYQMTDGVLVYDANRAAKIYAARLEAEALAEVQIRRQRETASLAEIAFVALAQTGQLDNATLTEHPSLFAQWDMNWTGKRGDIVCDGGKLYRSIHDIGVGQNTKPSDTPAMWTQIGDPSDKWPSWTQPIGAHDAYNAGAKATHNGGRWVSTVNGNVWEPGVYGWDHAG